MCRGVYFVLFLSCTTLLSQEIFHANFECGITHTLKKVKSGSKTIVLVENDRLSQWPKKGGVGVIQGNFPKKVERFEYVRREKNRLLGVTGINKNHLPWVDIRTGNFSQWYKKDLYFQRRVKGKISVIADSTLWGCFSVAVDCAADHVIYMRYKFLPQGPNHYFRYYLRFSKEMLQNHKLNLPFAFIRARDTSPSQLILQKTLKDQQAYISILKPDTGFSNIRFLTPYPVVAEKNYCIEAHINYPDSLVTYFVNSKKIGIARVRRAELRPKNIFHIGKFTDDSFQGKFFVDEFSLSETPMGPIPSRPVPIFHNGIFTLTNNKKSIAKIHWQISDNYSWLNLKASFEKSVQSQNPIQFPYYQILSDTVHESMILPEPLRLPLTLQKNTSYLFRMRVLNHHKHWSDWSVPTWFELQKPWVDRKAKQRPVIKNAYFTEIHKKKPLDQIQPGKWYDFYLYLQDLQGWKNIEIADMIFSGNSEEYLDVYRGRGGAFSPQNNYCINFSVQDYKAYVKQTQGSDQWIGADGEKYLYFDDTSKNYEQNALRGFIKARIRLLDSAKLGAWVMKGYAYNRQNLVSPLFSRVFLVQRKQNTAFTHNQNIYVAAIIFLSVCVLGLGFHVINNKMKKKEIIDLSKATNESKKSFEVYNSKIEMAKQFIEDNFSSAINTESIAKHLHLSASRIGKLFSKAMGQQIPQYINQVRIREAKRLLRQTDLSINEIAFRTGYASVTYFDSMFKKMEKISPKKFRDSSA